jgi:S-adenosylmethionine decarboxylase
MDTLGQHVIAELDGCDPATLSDLPIVRSILLEAARRTKATVLTDEMFAFKNGGVSGFVLLAESHVSIHTWPEHRYAAIDLYTCGDHTMPELGCAYLAAALGATSTTTTAMARGIIGPAGRHEHRVTVERRELIPSSRLQLQHSV